MTLVEELAQTLINRGYTLKDGGRLRIFTNGAGSKVVIDTTDTGFVVSIDDIDLRKTIPEGSMHLSVDALRLRLNHPICRGSVCYDEAIHAWRAAMFFLSVSSLDVVNDFRRSLAFTGMNVYGPMIVRRPDGDEMILEAHTTSKYVKVWVEQRGADVEAMLEALS